MQILDSDFTLLDRCQFINLARETAFHQIIEPIWADLDDFALGTQKIVLIPRDLDYVIKIPYLHYINHKIKAFSELKNAIYPFEQSQKVFLNGQTCFGDKNFLLPQFLLPHNPYGIPIYIQKKAISAKKANRNITCSQWKLEQLRQKINLYTKFPNCVDASQWNDSVLMWFVDLSQSIPLEQICCFLKEQEIRDIHQTNLGYEINSHQPVIFDYDR